MEQKTNSNLRLGMNFMALIFFIFGLFPFFVKLTSLSSH